MNRSLRGGGYQSSAVQKEIAYAFVGACAVGMVGCLWANAALPSVLLLAAAIGALAVADLRGVLVLAYPVYALFGAAAALTFLESGAYVSEQGRYGSNIGATPLFCLYSITFLSLAHGILSILAGTIRPGKLTLRGRSLFRMIALACVAISAFYIVTFFLFGTGLSYGTRFEWANTLPLAFRRLHALFRSYGLPVTFALAGLFVRLVGTKRSFPRLFVLAVPFLCLVATGEKFSTFIVLVLSVLTGQGIGGYLLLDRSRVRVRYLLPSGVVAAGLFAFLVVGYRRMGTTSVATSIRNRVALQGHVWFGILDRFNGKPEVSLARLVAPNSLASPAGLDLLSYAVADRTFVYNRLSQGIPFTMGGPPGALAAFGTFSGLLLYALTALFYVAAVWGAVVSLQRNHVFIASASLVFYTLLGNATMMGYWDVLYGPIAVAVYVAAAVAGLGLLWKKSTGSAKSPKMMGGRLERPQSRQLGAVNLQSRKSSV